MKSSGLFVFVLGLGLVLAGCASLNPSFGIMFFGQQDKKTQQTIDGTLTLESFCVFPLGMGFSSNDDMGLKIAKTERNGQKEYYFVAEVHTGNWVFAENIAVKFDDKIYQLHDDSPTRVVRTGNYVIEVLTFKITPEMLQSLQTSNNFTAELYKRVVSVDGKNLQSIKDFL
ncbi:MAG: hypothetical protein LBC53_04835 [Spirochaetaceae bacterium]|jgi:hypothetical protein|nr:hypothetical protein [Spirochaetaceae bacterium]